MYLHFIPMLDNLLAKFLPLYSGAESTMMTENFLVFKSYAFLRMFSIVWLSSFPKTRIVSSLVSESIFKALLISVSCAYNILSLINESITSKICSLRSSKFWQSWQKNPIFFLTYSTAYCVPEKNLLQFSKNGTIISLMIYKSS